jgi:hypothetical protein
MSTLIKTLASLLSLCALAIASPAYAGRLREHNPFPINDAAGLASYAGAQSQSAQPFFDFHNNFWVNLHHFLYQEALRLKRSQAGADKGSAAPSAATVAKVEGLSDEQQRIWQGALDYYQKSVVTRDLLFDQELVDVEYHLADSEKASSLKDSGIKPELVAVLEAAAPVYRIKWWPEHERANRDWIAAVSPMIEKYGKAVTAQLATAYRTVWPTSRIRADVTTYANWAGAYTVIDPTLITVSSRGKGNQGFSALEILFHESSHALIRQVRSALNEKFEAQKKPVARDLWHALLFYTTGEIIRRILAANNVKDYVPYAYANGLYARVWKQYQQALEREWQPYIEGKLDFDTALTRLVASL